MAMYTTENRYSIRTLNELLSYIRTNYPGEAAFSYRKGQQLEEISRENFYRDCMKMARLAERWPADRIAIGGDNSYAWIVAFLGIACCGKIAVLLDKAATPEETVQMLETSECTNIWFSDSFQATAEAVQAAGVKIPKGDQAKVCAETDARTETGTGVFITNLSEIMKAMEGECEDTVAFLPARDAIAAILFSSGTTGIRKAVPLTHGNIAADVFNTSKMFHPCEIRGTVVAALPLHHVFGLVCTILMGLVEIGTVFINDSLRRLPMDISFCHASTLIAVPAMVEMLLKLARGRKDPSKMHGMYGPQLKFIISGAGPMDPETKQAIEAADIHLFEGYGLTECASVATANTNVALYGVSVGTPVEGCQVRLSEEGEILLRGENVMSGYYNAPEENEKSFVDGWFRTGDLGRIGENGELYIVGRIKKLIILSNGENIPAEPLERLMYQLPYVKECVVRGIKDVITAEVFLDPEAPEGAQRIKEDVEIINRSLPLNRCIMDVVIRDQEFEKTSTNKIKI